MINKKYLSTIVFLILIITVVSGVLFVQWALGPLSYEKAQIEEAKGHQLVKDAKREEALKHFLNAAKREDDNINRSRRYEYAASTSSNQEDKIRFFKFALGYSENNKEAKNQLRKLLGNEEFELYMAKTNSFKYKNRSYNGWTEGKSAEISVDIQKDFKYEYEISYFTVNPSGKSHKVNILLDNKLVDTKYIESDKRYYSKMLLDKGAHTISITIDETFNPKKLNMSQDSRDLGVNFIFKEVGVVIDTIDWLGSDKKVKIEDLSKKSTNTSDRKVEIKYIDRYTDGWSYWKRAWIAVYSEHQSEFILEYFTTNPKKQQYDVKIYVDKKLLETKKIETKQNNELTILIPKGLHIIEVEIDDVFIPSKNNMGSDSRTLGINFKIKEK